MFNKIYVKFKQKLIENWKFIISLIVLFLVFTIELPYVIYTPGGSIVLNDRITIDGTNETKGEFGMAYVSMVRGSIPFLIASYIIPNWDIKPASTVTYDDGESIHIAVERDKIFLQEANDNAIYVAYTNANKKISVKSVKNVVVYITDEATTGLELFDEIIKMDDLDFENIETLREYLQTKNEDDLITFKIIRNKKEKEVTAKIHKSEDGMLRVGISTVTLYNYDTEPVIKIKTKNSESGASGGLMMSLSIYNQLSEEDIIKGRYIIGTGTISKDGKVGEIGGIKYKLLGAEKKKADIFLCPEENLEEALKVKKDNQLNIEVIGVKTFEEALRILK